jgi:hypothetical protein
MWPEEFAQAAGPFLIANDLVRFYGKTLESAIEYGFKKKVNRRCHLKSEQVRIYPKDGPSSQETQMVADVQELQVFIPDGANTPLHDTPARRWSLDREATMKVVEDAVTQALEQTPRLLAAVETAIEDDNFEVPPFVEPIAEPVVAPQWTPPRIPTPDELQTGLFVPQH